MACAIPGFDSPWVHFDTMRLEHYPASKLKCEIRAAVARHLDPKQYRVFIFGSRARGTAHDRSDIDVGIEGPRPIPASKLLAIRDEITELPVLYKIDVVDFKRVSPGFKALSQKHREML